MVDLIARNRLDDYSTMATYSLKRLVHTPAHRKGLDLNQRCYDRKEETATARHEDIIRA